MGEISESKTVEVAPGIVLTLRRAADVAELPANQAYRDLLYLVTRRAEVLLENVRTAEDDAALLQAARDYRMVVQSIEDLGYWPRHCAKMVEEALHDTGGEDQGVAGGAGRGGAGQDGGGPAAEEGYDLAG